jgi:hypothetical protein
MTRPLFMLVLLSILLMSALPAFASIQFVDPENPTCGEIDPNKPCYSSFGAKYTECKALSWNLEKCQECVFNKYNKEVCASVRHSASCWCEDKPVDGAGPGITACSPFGTCTYIN